MCYGFKMKVSRQIDRHLGDKRNARNTIIVGFAFHIIDRNIN